MTKTRKLYGVLMGSVLAEADTGEERTDVVGYMQHVLMSYVSK
jgi:hypothetical protein